MTKTLLFLLLTLNICSAQKLNTCSVYLIDHYYNLPVEKKIIQEILSPNDSTIFLNDLFQIIHNENKDRLLAFFVSNNMSKNKLADKLSFNLTGSVPQYEGFTMSAIKYNGKWFYIRNNVMNFSEGSIDSARRFYFCETLLLSNFMNCLTKKPRKDFWNSNEFSEVKINKLWNPSDLEINKPYLGLPEIVASNLKDTFNLHKKRADQLIYSNYIIPHVKKLKQDPEYEDVSAVQMTRDFILIHPPDRTTILYPINLKRRSDTLYTLKFFALQKKDNHYELYEWNYLEPVNYKKRVYVSPLYETLNGLTYWTYTMPHISNIEFWEKYVTKKQDEHFLYLKEVR